LAANAAAAAIVQTPPKTESFGEIIVVLRWGSSCIKDTPTNCGLLANYLLSLSSFSLSLSLSLSHPKKRKVGHTHNTKTYIQRRSDELHFEKKNTHNTKNIHTKKKE
jgi:hypothetical protein